MRSRLPLALGLFLVACNGDARRSEEVTRGSVGGVDSASTVLRAFPSFSALGDGATLILREGRLRPASALHASGGWPALEVSLPVRAHEPLHLALANRAEVSIDVADVDNEHVEGAIDGGRVAFASAAPDVDVVAGIRGAAVETVRILRAPAASSTWRMRVVVGAGVATLRAREGRIEAVEPSGNVSIASAPLFAVDARGVQRALTVAVRSVGARTYEVDAQVDARDLRFPVALDPLWTTVPTMAIAHDSHAATVLADGRVLVTGGSNAGAPTNRCEVFNPATNTWSSVASMTAARADHTATLLGDGRVFVSFGTGTGDAKLSTAEIYDPTANRWTDVTTTSFIKPVPRNAHTATLLPTGEVLMAGGVTGTSPETTTNRQVLYNPATNTWNIPFDPGFSSFMKDARAYHTAVLVGSKVYVLGGEKLDATTGAASPLNSIESWSASGGWVLSPTKLSQARCEHAATVMSDGKIMLVGGGSRCRLTGSTPIAKGELYDPATDTIASSVPALVAARSRHTLTKLPSGQLLVTGGSGTTGAGGSFFTSAEIFDGTKWSLTESMTTARFRHTAHLLADGRVLVVGSGMLNVRSAEVFQPTTGGTACTSGTSCASGFCVDGFCCDTACNGNCESCAVEGSAGTCKTISGEPVGSRPKCADGGTNACAAKRCDGVSRDCVFVGSETSCGKASCATGTAVSAPTCNGAGACGTPTTKECAPYICGVEACRTDCTIDDQCVKGFTCVDGACKSGASCLPDGTSKGNDGKITQCAPYKCGGDGLCMNACASSADCVTGSTCDVDSKVCVPQSGGDSGDSGGCGIAAPGHASSTAWIVAALALLGTRRRRR